MTRFKRELLDFNQIYKLGDNNLKPLQEKIKMSKFPLCSTASNEKRSTRQLSLMQDGSRKPSFVEEEFEIAREETAFNSFLVKAMIMVFEAKSI